MKSDWWKRGAAACVLCGAAAIVVTAQTFTTLHSFDGTDGENPEGGPLVQARDGSLYGTTQGGGYGLGSVFKITPSGVLTTIYSFCSQIDCTDGYLPVGGLIQATDGNFYGTTTSGGANTSQCGSYGCGTVFKLTPSGELTTLHSFCSQSDCADGYDPWAELVQATDGNLYGTTTMGGTGGFCAYFYGCGTIFKITSSGKLSALYSFCSQSDCADGLTPRAGLIQGADGNLYGATDSGGDLTCTDGAGFGCGTLFKITPGNKLTTLYTFCQQSDCPDGSSPASAMVQASDGNLYGTTFFGGVNGEDAGTIFKITPEGAFTTLYSFCSPVNCPNGAEPVAGLIQATDGSLYGTTQGGGASNNGTIFKITLGGELTTLYNFCPQSGCMDGARPLTTLVQDTRGSFYGATYNGGASNDGTVFSLSTGLGQFVETRPSSGKVGTVVKILGSNLKGATSVTFNGTPATFTVDSNSLITTTVPSGATTGKVEVVTSGHTLSSNVNFRVL